MISRPQQETDLWIGHTSFGRGLKVRNNYPCRRDPVAGSWIWRFAKDEWTVVDFKTDGELQKELERYDARWRCWRYRSRGPRAKLAPGY